MRSTAHDLALLAASDLVRPRDLGVEILDQPVPLRKAVGDAVPERLRPAALEILDADALLLDPGVVAEVENLAPQLIGQLHHIVGRDRGQAGAENLARIHLVERAAEMLFPIIVTLAVVERCAVGRDRDDDVIRPVVKLFCQLDRCDDVGETGNADIGEGRNQPAVELAAILQIVSGRHPSRTAD